MVELLENENYTSVEHIQFRVLLAKQLLGFTETLSMVKSQFPESKTQRAAKKARTVKIKQEVDLLLTLAGLVVGSHAFQG